MASLMPVWDQRIARARHLSAISAHAREVLDFYGSLAGFQRGLSSSASPLALDDGAFADAVDLEAAAAAIPGFLDWLRRHGPARMAEALPEIDRVALAQWRDLMRQRLMGDDRESSDPDALTGFVAEVILQPFAEAAAVPRRGRLGSGSGDRRACCPVCGDRPSVGALREEGQGAKRTLVCGLCLTEWDYLRVVCLACDEERFDALPVYTTDALPHTRVDACDSCRTYLKTVDFTKDGTAVPLVDDLASLPLDLWARDHGYHRLRPTLFRI